MMDWVALIGLTLLAAGAMIGLDAIGLWTAIGSTASGIVGMLLGCLVLCAAFGLWEA